MDVTNFVVVEQGIVPIYKNMINGQYYVNGRELHKFLENGRNFSNWATSRNKKYEYSDPEDLITFELISPTGRPFREFYYTVDVAKELAMIEDNHKGKEARRYFIAADKKLKEVINNPELLMNHNRNIKSLSKEELTQQLIEARGEISTLKKQIQTMNANGFDPNIAPITMTTASKQIGTTLHILQSNIIYLLVSIIHQYTDKLRGLRIEYNVSNKERKPHPRLCFTQEGFEEVVEMLYSKKLITESQKEKAFQLITTTV